MQRRASKRSPAPGLRWCLRREPSSSGSAGGISGEESGNLVSGEATERGDLAFAGVVGGIVPLGPLRERYAPSYFDVLRRLPYPEPRTFEGIFVNWGRHNTTALWGSAVTGAAYGSGLELGWKTLTG